MDYVSAINDLASRMTDEVTLKSFYEQGKKLIKKTRCAPAHRIPKKETLPPDDLPDVGVPVRSRTRR